VTATAWVGWSGSTRVVVARLVVPTAGNAALKLTRGKKVLARRKYALRKGTNTLRLALPRRVNPGWSRLVVTVGNPSGRAQVVTMRVQLPKARA
jgi:hypothetical protein